jgi:hypothetical protein
MKIDRRKKYDWSKADWSLKNAAIASVLGCTEAAVGAARKIYAPDTKRVRKASVALTERGDVSMFLENLKPGQQFWMSGDSKSAWEVLQCGAHRLDVKATCQTFDATPIRVSYGPSRQVTLVTIIEVNPLPKE